MDTFLACYDYGQGGIWFYVPGENVLSLSKNYPGLVFFESDPPWWNSEYEDAARKHDVTQSPFKEILEGARIG